MTGSRSPQPHPALLIRPATGLTLPDPRELWEHRELLWFLMWRDIAVRYKQTALGAAWAILQPILMMLVFTVVFGRLGKMPSDGVPYPLFAFCGLLPWQLFAFALSSAANSLVMNERLVTRTYFPRIIMPMASVLAGMVDFSIAFVVLLGLMLYYGITPTVAIFTLPAFVLLAVAAAVAVGLGLSALNVQFRDVKHALPFLTQFWMLATPIAYPVSIFPPKWQPLLGLNPMSGVVEGFRWALLASPESPGTVALVSAVVTVGLLSVSAVYFFRVERTLADVI